MARRRGRYRMTPARRAALHRAQMISAQKRRGSRFQGLKNFGKAAAAVGGAVAISAAVYHAEDLAKRGNKATIVGGVRTTHRFIRSRITGSDPNAPHLNRIRNPRTLSRTSVVRPLGRGAVAGRRISSRQRSRLR